MDSESCTRRHCRRDELECVTANVNIRNGLFDLRHMAIHAFAAGAPSRVVRVLLDRRCTWPVRRTRAVAGQTKLASGLNQVGVVWRAVDIVATEASDAAFVHLALYKIIALHSILCPVPLA